MRAGHLHFISIMHHFLTRHASELTELADNNYEHDTKTRMKISICQYRMSEIYNKCLVGCNVWEGGGEEVDCTVNMGLMIITG